MKHFPFLIFLFALASVFFLSCGPDGIGSSKEKLDEAAIVEIVQAQEAFSDVFNVGDLAMDESGVKKTSDLCADIFLSLSSKSLLIDFGTGCTGIDGKTRSGSILIKFVGKFWEPGAQFIYTLTDYTVDGTEVDGTITLSSFDRDSSGLLFVSFSVAGGEITYPDSSFVTYETERIYTWIEGEGSGTPDDNVYAVTGFANGQTSSGAGYDAEILTGLQYKTACAYDEIFYPVEGELKIVRNNIPSPYLINFGSGVCDKEIVVDWNGQVQSVILP